MNKNSYMKGFMRKAIISIVMICFLCATAAGAEKKRIAVLPFSTENVSPVTGKIVRDIIEVELISSRHFTVIERDQMGAILKEQKLNPKVCDETACAFKYGKALSIDYMVIGKVMKLKNFVVSLRLIDVRNRVVLSAEKLKSGSVEDLEDLAEELAENFLDQLNSDNPISYRMKTKRNRPGTISMSFFTQYTLVPSMGPPSLIFPKNYGDPIKAGMLSKNRHAAGLGLSASVSLLPWLSLRGDLSFIASISFSGDNFMSYDKTYPGEGYYRGYWGENLCLPHGFSGDILVQFNWLWGPVMPHVSIGVGYSRYWRATDEKYHADLSVNSEAEAATDYYDITAEMRKNLVSIVGDIGFTLYFNNTIGLTITWGMRYAPKQSFYKNTVFNQTNNINPSVEYKVTNGDAKLMHNFRLGFILRKL